MTRIYNLSQPPIVNWYSEDQETSNRFCPYCGSDLFFEGAKASNKEHLVGRNFVPKGTLGSHDSFNFIFRACVECNSQKACAEGYASATSLAIGHARHDDERAKTAAEMKEQLVWQKGRPGKPISEERHEREVSGQFGNATIKFGLTSPAKHDDHDVNLIAFRQVQALFTMVTSEDPTKSETTRLLTSSGFHLWDSYHFADWGHPHATEVARRLSNYSWFAKIDTAEGFFRARLGLSSDQSHWFWALEWNRQIRLIGWLGASETPSCFSDLPDEGWNKWIKQPDGSSIRTRFERPLSEDSPDLFAVY